MNPLQTPVSPDLDGKDTEDIPYLGLRPFEEQDQKYFHGRREHINQVLERLEKHRFVAVVGLSGAGKSSIVRAGVIPDLRAGRLKNSSSHWIIGVMTPGIAPVRRLGIALGEAVRDYETEMQVPRSAARDDWADRLDVTVSRGSMGLVQAIRDAKLPERTQLLLVVDQFEELFRFREQKKKDEAEGFVQKLLKAVGDESSRTYVVVTMRSEFLGDCAGYEGLAEAVNEGMYLTPRLSRDQLRVAITVPATIRRREAGEGKEVGEDLVERLVDDVADNQDQLPVLQHALMRCWKKREPGQAFDLDLYLRIGGKDALDQHAEDILKKLKEGVDAESGQRREQIVKRLFKRITRAGSKESVRNREDAGLRDSAPLATVWRDIGCDRAELEELINQFRQPSRAFLRPVASEALTDDSMIDITHESLIRKWKRLGVWVEEEEHAAAAYRKLVEETAKAARAAGSAAMVSATIGTIRNLPTRTLSRADLYEFAPFRDDKTWDKAWANRYGRDFDRAMEYLQSSEQAHLKEDEDARQAIESEARRGEEEAKRHAEAERVHHEQELRILELERKKAEESALLLATEAKAAHERAKAKWLLRAVLVGTLALAVLVGLVLITFDKTRFANETIIMTKLLQTAADVSTLPDDRVPAAIGAYWLGGNVKANDFVEQTVGLEQWEQFSALRVSRQSTKPDPGHGSINVGGADVSNDEKHAAIANGVDVRVWNLDSQRQSTPATVPDGMIQKLEGAERVSFNATGDLLLASGMQKDHTKAILQLFDLKEERLMRRGPERAVVLKQNVPDDGIAAVTFLPSAESPSTEDFAVLTYYGQLQFFPPRTGPDLPHVEMPVAFAKTSPDGAYLLISYGIDTGVDGSPSNLIVDLRTGRKDSVFAADPKNAAAKRWYPLSSAAFSENGECLIAGTPYGGVLVQKNPLWPSPPSCDEASVMAATDSSTPYIDGVTAVAVWRDDHDKQWRFAAGTQNGFAYQYSKESEFPLGWGMKSLGAVTSVSPGTDRDHLVTASNDQKARIFESNTGTEEIRVPHQSRVVFAMATKAGKVVSASADGVLLITDPSDYEKDANAPNVPAARKSWTSCDPESPDLLVRFCDKIGLLNSSTTNSSRSVPPILTLSGDGKTLAWIDMHNGQIQIEPSSAGPGDKPIWASPQLDKTKLALSFDGGWAAAATTPAGQDAVMAVFPMTGGKPGAVNTSTLPLNIVQPAQTETCKKPDSPEKMNDGSPMSQITALAVASDGSAAVGTSNGTMLWYPRGKQTQPHATRCSPYPVAALAFTKDGASLLIGYSNKKIDLWKVADRSLLYRVDDTTPASFLALSPGGTAFAAVYGGSARSFVLESNGFRPAVKILQEPGTIQALTFADSDKKNEFTRWVVIPPPPTESGKRSTLARATHHTQIRDHARSICKNQPLDYQPDLQAFLNDAWKSDRSHSITGAAHVCQELLKN